MLAFSSASVKAFGFINCADKIIGYACPYAYRIFPVNLTFVITYAPL